MNAILLGVVPIFALIAIGWGLRVSKFIPEQNWPPIERLAYFVFYPGFLLPAAWSADFTNGSALALTFGTIFALLTVSAASLAAKPLLKLNGPSFTSVFQGNIRYNSFVFIPIILALFGQPGVGLAAVVLGALIPVSNVVCVLVLAKWGEGQGGRPRDALVGMAKNPVILSCLGGLLLNALHIPQPEMLAKALKLLSDAALAVGLIVAGAGLSFRYALSRPWLISGVSFVKRIILPILMWTFTRLLGGDPLSQGIALACGSAPGAAASYVLARQMGGDAPLMAGIVAFTTAASLFTIPLVMALFHLG